MTPRLSLQLYSVREQLSEDFDGTIAKIAEFGYRHVEPYGIEKFTTQLAQSLPAHGLQAPTAHSAPLTGDLGTVIKAAQQLGIGRVIQPYTPPEQWETADGVKQLADQLNEVAAKLKAEGLALGYHNHHFELVPKFEGVHALEVLAERLDPEIGLEVDTYWAHVGGADVPALLQRLGERVIALHIKDGPGNRDNKAQVAVGAGDMPVLDFMAAAPWIADGVVELDDTSGDMLAAVRDSFTYLQDKGEWA